MGYKQPDRQFVRSLIEFVISECSEWNERNEEISSAFANSSIKYIAQFAGGYIIIT